MTGAQLVHDTLEQEGWDVEIADAQKVKGLAPLACKTDKIDSMVLAVLSHRDLVPAIWLPDPRIREERELARFRMHLVKHKSALKNRVHSTLNFGRPCPVTDLFGAEGRRLLAKLDVPEPWRGNVMASVELIDDLERQIAEINRRLKQGHADHPYVPAAHERPRRRPGARVHDRGRDRRDRALLIAREAHRLYRPLPASTSRRQGPPRAVDQARADLPALGAARGDHARASPPRLRRALPAHQARLGKQRGAKVAQVDVARRLAHAIWRLPATSSSLPEAPVFVWRPDRPFGHAPRANVPISPDPPAKEAIET